MVVNRQKLLERFLRYVRIETTANPQTDAYPSSEGQLVLGRLLAEELREMGARDVELTAHGLVFATIPSSVDHPTPVIAFNAHLDTSPDASGKDVQPQVIEHYQGGDIVLPGDTSKVITATTNPELEGMAGCTLVTSDGTTLLGGDDKAGVAIIMQTVESLLTHPQIPHGTIRVMFTCDEEIGRGVQHVDLPQLAADACYTLDGPGADSIDVETFSADLATVTVRGVNIHPAIAKDRMINAVRGLGYFISCLPAEASPERTDGRDGFLHPYTLHGAVDETELKILLRSFDTAKLEAQAELLRTMADKTRQQFPGISVDVAICPQYRNLGDGLAKAPQTVEFAEEAHRRLGRTPRRDIVRGGTDGSRLTELGLPTPNLSSGQHNLHSPLEWVCLDEMVQAVEVCVALAGVWSESPQS